MPFKTSIVYKNSSTIDNLDSMMYHQMAGRAGRRGLDKEGNVIFIGYGWDRIKELSISHIPFIKGASNIIHSYQQAYNMTTNENYLSINKNLFKSKYPVQYIHNFDSALEIKHNTTWDFAIEKDINLIQLHWVFRYSNEATILTFLLPYFTKYFSLVNPNEENMQIELAFFISKFIDIIPSSNEKNILSDTGSLKIDYEKIYDELDKINLNICKFVDNRIFISIRNNCLVDKNDDILRQRLFDFSVKMKGLQHYFYHMKNTNLTKLTAKCLTRCWWIYHGSSCIMKV
jgi:hypothetical protein